MTKVLVGRELLERIVSKMNIVWQKTDETEELRAILAQPAHDVAMLRKQLEEARSLLEESNLMIASAYGTGRMANRIDAWLEENKV